LWLASAEIGSFDLKSGLPVLDLRDGAPHALLVIPVPHFVDPVPAGSGKP